MRAKLAHVLAMKGVLRFTMDRQQKMSWNDHATDEKMVAHYNLELDHQANKLATKLNMNLPAPLLKPFRPDNGERFGFDYCEAQWEREQKYDYSAKLTRCPCDPCVKRRGICPCDSCCLFRNGHGDTVVIYPVRPL